MNHFIAGQNPHPPDERIQIDQLRNPGSVADECVGVESGGFLDEAPIEPFALGNRPGMVALAMAVGVVPIATKPTPQPSMRIL